MKNNTNKKYIQNYAALSTSEGKRNVLSLAEEGLRAIDTETVLHKSIHIKENTLIIQKTSYCLSDYKRIFIIGFGKVSCKAASVLEEILKDRINGGIVLGIESDTCETIDTYEGTHPRPSSRNVEISQKIAKISKNATKDDLVITIVSGGGSSLLCYPQEECDQGKLLYDSFLTSGGTTRELNTVRKHISLLKGGGLAKILYPATVVALIFSDIPGNFFEEVASGPTYRDSSTIADAQSIIDKYNLGSFRLTETPKDTKYFDNMTNIVLVSSTTALQAMAKKAKNMGLKTTVLGSELCKPAKETVRLLSEAARDADVVLAGGETQIQVECADGEGGRNQHLSLAMLEELKNNQVFLSIASDGWDNTPVAGAIIDEPLRSRTKDLGLNPENYLSRCDSFSFFEKVGGHIITGRTSSNVADLMILMNS